MALRIAVVVLVFAADFVARHSYEEILHPSALAFAREDEYDCASFGSREPAQAELERDPSYPNNLDENGDGAACENYDYGTGGAVDDRYDAFPLMDSGDCPTPLVKRDEACYPG